MSTRGLLGFVHKGEIHACYNHFDSYLEGLGQDIVKISNIIIDWNAFTRHYEKVIWVSNINESIKYLSGKEILIEMLKGESLTLLDEIGFAKNEISCQYAYLINLDAKQLEIYASNFHTNHDQSEAKIPLNLLVSYPLESIPNHWLQTLNTAKIRSDVDWNERLKVAKIDPNNFFNS
jgi:hypothetical protein